MPAYKVIFLYSRQLPQEHWTTYFRFSNGILGQGWLWFLPVLFLFDALFWALAQMKVRAPEISLRTGVIVAFLVGVLYSLAISLLGLTGWTKTFRVGKRLYFVACATAWIPINVYLITLLSLLFRPGEYFISLTADLLVMWCAFYLSLLILLYLVLATLRFWGNGHGALGRVLGGSSYAVYVIHLPILGGIALALLDAPLPSLAKFAVLAASTYVASNVIAYGYRVTRLRLASRAGVA